MKLFLGKWNGTTVLYVIQHDPTFDLHITGEPTKVNRRIEKLQFMPVLPNFMVRCEVPIAYISLIYVKYV